jgi:hypothetical protein
MMLSTSRALIVVALALALLAGGCGNDENESPAAGAGTVTTAGAVDEYREQVVAIVTRTDEARGNFRGAPPGQEVVTAARELALASRAAARDVDSMSPPASVADLDRQLAANYRLWAAKLEAELARKPVSLERLGDVVRANGKLVDDVYEDILIAP